MSSSGLKLSSYLDAEKKEAQCHASEEAGSSTSSKDQSLAIIIVEEPDIATREMWLSSLKQECVKAKAKARRREMHKVPAMFLANGKSSSTDYKPKVVSLGPYHRGNPELREFQDRKASMAGKFVPKKNVETSLRRKIRNNIGQLMASYSQEWKKFDSNEWEEMLFLDGCFVLYFVCCIIYNQVEDLKMKKYEIDSVHNDLFLLENQLPFQLLKILSGNDSELLNWLDEYIHAHKISTDVCWDWRQEEPVHLLDRLRTIIIGGRSETHNWHSIFNFLDYQALQSTRMKSTVLRHAKELSARGIHLKLNRSGLLKDISFRSHFIYGTIRLPRVIVDDSTRPLLLNLAAYEMCADVGSTITSYICFLDSLVNHAEDIKELQSAGVLVNHLATDEDAAKLFNEMAQGLHPDTDVYMDVKRKIQKFFEHKTKASVASWIAEGYHNHFKSPLTAMAVLAAFLVLVFTGTQTYFTVFPRGDK